MFYGHAGFAQHVNRQIVRVILAVVDVADAAVDEHLGAQSAGVRGAVEFRALNADAVDGGLNDDVLLGMEPAADFVALARRDAETLAQAACLQAVGHASGRAVVACGKNALVLDGNGADLASGAGGAFTDEIGDIHEIVWPWHALHNHTLWVAGSLHAGAEKAKSAAGLRPGRKALSRAFSRVCRCRCLPGGHVVVQEDIPFCIPGHFFILH